MAILILSGACGGRAGVVPVSQPAPGPAPADTADRSAATPDYPGEGGVTEEVLSEDGFAGDDVTEAAPPPGGAGARSHTIRRGETLYSLARRYAVPVDRLMRVNGITDPRQVPSGMRLVIPDGGNAAPARGGRASKSRPAKRQPARSDRPPMAKAQPAAAPIQSATILPVPSAPPGQRLDPGGAPLPAGPGAGSPGLALAWPVGGRLTGSFGRRGRSVHEGIDIDGRKGQPVRAAAGGIVQRTGEDGKYGKLVVIDHGGGITTLYAHASRILVRAGDRVERNEPIAEVGRTGNASGHHLHFEIRRDGRPIDPLPVLRSGVLRIPVADASSR